MGKPNLTTCPKNRKYYSLIRKQFESKGKLFKIGVGGLDNNGIFFKLKSTLQDTQENSYLFKYHFDLEVLSVLGRISTGSVCYQNAAHNKR
jgi:hypothetical protein